MTNLELKDVLLMAMIRGSVSSDEVLKISSLANRIRAAREELQEYGVEINFAMPNPEKNYDHCVTISSIVNELKKLIADKDLNVCRDGKPDFLSCIKWLRNQTRFGLKQSKDYLDAHRAELGL